MVICWKNEKLFGNNGARFILSMRSLILVSALFLYYQAIRVLPPSDLGALGSTSVIFTAILSRFIFKEKFGIPIFASILLTIIGVTLISKPSFLFKTTEIKILNHSTQNTSSSIGSDEQENTFTDYELQLGSRNK